MIYNEKHLNLLKRVRSIRKLGFRFQSQDQVGIFNRTQNSKTGFIAKKSVLIFFLSVFVMYIQNGYKKLFSRKAKMQGYAQCVEKRPLFTAREQFCKSLFGFLNQKSWNPDLDFIIEIHLEDGCLGGKIRFRISGSKSGFEIWQPNPNLLLSPKHIKTNNWVRFWERGENCCHPRKLWRVQTDHFLQSSSFKKSHFPFS